MISLVTNFQYLFKDQEVAHQAQTLKVVWARAFEEKLTQFVPNLKQVRALLKLLQFRIGDFKDNRAVIVELVLAAGRFDDVELVKRNIKAHFLEHFLG